jgi:hypothetical protein
MDLLQGGDQLGEGDVEAWFRSLKAAQAADCANPIERRAKEGEYEHHCSLSSWMGKAGR